ncbi:MAG: nitrate- and nitrite sensing domain-containing protein [Acidimicrobiia bacterium]
MFRTTHIRTKLAAALSVPLIVLVAVAGYEVTSATEAVDDARAQAELATSSLGPGSLVVTLQDERNRASIDLIGLGDSADLAVATNEEARERTDHALAQLRQELATAPAAVQDAFATAMERIEAELDGLRTEVDGYDGPMDLSNDELADEVFSRYTELVEELFDATSSLALTVDDADLRNGVQLIDAATRQSENRARILRTAVLSTVTGTVDAPATLAELSALHDRGQGLDDAIRTNAVGPFAGLADQTFAEPTVQDINAQVEGYLAGEPFDIGTMLSALSAADDEGYIGLRNRTGVALQATANDIYDDAVARQRLFVAVAAGALILAIVVTWLASRSITRPLRSLKLQAEHMAGTSLPTAVREILETPAGEDVVIPEVEPIRVKSRDEVADVAGALSAVQSSALDLAVEQAVLRRNISDSYVNLGRRNQNLLTRQLDFITELERNESDPDTLEGLFKLDHLATRMRRNAESLLVLAGIEPPRQWSAPVKVADVVRAALGEVEDYQRVVVRHLEPAALTGSVASDVAHVVAELLENALSFSPPEQSVEVKGRLTIAGYTFAITDNGLGMSAEDLARANRRLAGQESFTVAPSRYLGHYVAGHLASRMGLSVELQDSPAGGVTARVDVPMDLLANEETDPFVVARSPEAAAAAPAPVRSEPEGPTGPISAPAGAPSSFTDSGLPRRGSRTPLADDRPEPAEEPAPATASDEPPTPADRPASSTDGPTSVPAPTLSWRSVPADPAASSNGRTDEWSTPTASSWADRPLSEDEPVTSGPGASHRESQRDDPASAPEAPVAEEDPSQAPEPQDDPTWSPPGPASNEPANGAAAAMAPASPSVEAVRGFGGLAVARPAGTSMFTVAAEQARQRTAGEEPAPEATTPTGLVRRVPGAQRPDVPLGSSRQAAAPAPEEKTTPEDVYAFLSSFQSGVSRGKADAHGDRTEDER